MLFAVFDANKHSFQRNWVWSEHTDWHPSSKSGEVRHILNYFNMGLALN